MMVFFWYAFIWKRALSTSNIHMTRRYAATDVSGTKYLFFYSKSPENQKIPTHTHHHHHYHLFIPIHLYDLIVHHWLYKTTTGCVLDQWTVENDNMLCWCCCYAENQAGKELYPLFQPTHINSQGRHRFQRKKTMAVVMMISRYY